MLYVILEAQMGDVNGVLIKGRVRSRGTGPAIFDKKLWLQAGIFVYLNIKVKPQLLPLF